jgi:hypothetical protein
MREFLYNPEIGLFLCVVVVLVVMARTLGQVIVRGLMPLPVINMTARPVSNMAGCWFGTHGSNHSYC